MDKKLLKESILKRDLDTAKSIKKQMHWDDVYWIQCLMPDTELALSEKYTLFCLLDTHEAVIFFCDKELP